MAIACLSEETSITPREKEARLRQGPLHVGGAITPGLLQKMAKEKAMLNQVSALSCASSSHDGEAWRSHSIQSSPIEDRAEQLKKIHPMEIKAHGFFLRLFLGREEHFEKEQAKALHKAIHKQLKSGGLV